MSSRTPSVSVGLPYEVVITAKWSDRTVTGVYRTKKSILALLRTKEVEPDVVFVDMTRKARATKRRRKR